MASSMPSENEDEFLPGFKDVTEFTQQILRKVVQATKYSNDLPAAGDDFDYYSSFQGFRDILDIEGKRILHIIQNVLKYEGVKGKLSVGTSDVMDLEDKFDVLADANDQILERVGAWLDEASGIKKDDNTLVIATATPKQTSTSWNKKVNKSPGKMSSFHLLTARSILRPQIRFKDKVDNSNRPFVPCLKHKPNALVSLEESLKLPEGLTEEELEQPDFVYPHPYQYELDNWHPRPEDLDSTEPTHPNPVDETPLTMVTTVSALVELCDLLKQCKEIAVDLEHHSYRTFQGITCLMQISTRNQDFLLDTLELRSDLHLLNEVFTDPAIIKVFHGADSDVEWLQRDFGVYVVNMFDTGQAAKVLNLARFSLSHLLKLYCNVDADKQYQLADWRIRPLPDELIKYAREDTHYLLYIYDMMKKELIERGNEQKNLLQSVLHRSKEVSSKVYKMMILKDQDYLELYHKSKKIFNSQQLEALKNLYTWRDRTGRREDESLGYVLPNHMLLQISEILPRERQGVFACCNPIPPLVRQFVNEIHQIILEARETQLYKVEVKNLMHPTVQQHPKYDSESLLHCPHDLSHQTQGSSDSVMLDLQDSLLVPNTSMSTCNKSKILTKLVPLLTAFGQNGDNVLSTKAQRTAQQIKALFVSPFTKYLPAADQVIRKSKLGEITSNSKEKIELANVSWTLMKNTVKRKEPDSTPAEQTSPEPPMKRKRIEVVVQEDTSLKTMSVKQIKQQMRKEVQQMKKEDQQIKKDDKQKTVINTGSGSNNPDRNKEKKKEKKEKQERKAKDESTKEEFRSYDYSKMDRKMFEGGPGKSNVYDATRKGSSKGKDKKVHKPQLSTSKSNKSHSYTSKGGSNKKHHWPKK